MCVYTFDTYDIRSLHLCVYTHKYVHHTHDIRSLHLCGYQVIVCHIYDVYSYQMFTCVCERVCVGAGTCSYVGVGVGVGGCGTLIAKRLFAEE